MAVVAVQKRLKGQISALVVRSSSDRDILKILGKGTVTSVID